MDEAGTAFRDLDRVVVTTGPGSFTGLRVGIAAARGIALAIDKPAVGLSTLSAYAAPYLADDDNAPVVVAIDARHEPRLSASFRRRRPHGHRSTAGAAERSGARGGRGAGPHRRLGRATRSPTRLPSPTQRRYASTPRGAPDIDWVARMGAALPEGQSPPKPQYLRAPDAQPQNAAQLPRR